MSTTREPDVAEERIRKALAHVRRAHHLVEPLSDLIDDDVGNVVVQEEIKATYYAIRDYGYYQFGVDFEAPGAEPGPLTAFT